MSSIRSDIPPPCNHRPCVHRPCVHWACAHRSPTRQLEGTPASQPKQMCIYCAPNVLVFPRAKTHKDNPKDSASDVDRARRLVSIMRDIAAVIYGSMEEMGALARTLEEIKKSAEAMTKALEELKETASKKEDV